MAAKCVNSARIRQIEDVDICAVWALNATTIGALHSSLALNAYAVVGEALAYTAPAKDGIMGCPLASSDDEDVGRYTGADSRKVVDSRISQGHRNSFKCYWKLFSVVCLATIYLLLSSGCFVNLLLYDGFFALLSFCAPLTAIRFFPHIDVITSN